MGCLGNSKTEDQRIDEKAQREANKKIEKQLQKERQAYKATHRLLLLGKLRKVVIFIKTSVIGCFQFRPLPTYVDRSRLLYVDGWFNCHRLARILSIACYMAFAKCQRHVFMFKPAM